MQEGRKCIFLILQEKQFCGLISFVFHCSLASYFVHKNVNTLSWDLYYDSKCVILHLISISTTNLISPKMSLTIFLHSHDELGFRHHVKSAIILQKRNRSADSDVTSSTISWMLWELNFKNNNCKAYADNRDNSVIIYLIICMIWCKWMSI